MRRTSLLLATVALVLAGCAQQPSAVALVAAAPTQTTGAGTARMAMTVDTEGGEQALSLTGDGAIDFEGKRGTLTMKMSGMPGAPGGLTMETRYDGTVFYMKLPEEMTGGQLPTEWVKFDLTETEGMAGFDQLQQMGGDPTQGLEVLRGVSGEVEEVGTEDVRGTSTTHYRATVDLDKAVAEAPERARNSVRQLIEQLGTSEMPVEVWIDEEGRLRRQRQRLDLSQATGAAPAQGGTVTTTVEYFDFGIDVDVQPPPADQVTDLQELQGAGGG